MNSSTRSAGSENVPAPQRRLPSASLGGRRAAKPVRLTSDHRSRSRSGGRPARSSSSSCLGAKQAQVRPEERALPDEPERRPGQAADPHQSRPAAAGPLPDRVVGQRQAPAGRVRGPGHQLRGHGQPQTGAQRPVDKAGEQGFVGTALSERRHRRSSASPAASNRAPVTTSPPSPTRGGKPKVLVKNAFEPDWSR